LVSLLIVAFVFAIEHMAGGSRWVEALFGASIGSLLFGMASIATKGLAVPIGLHAAWNFGDWMRGGKSSSGLWKSVVADGFQERVQLVAMSGYAVVMLSATFASWWWYRRSMYEGQGSVPRVTKILTVE
jgi:membrane protease YdiL (CAAX protease family)